jgi:hypothetical protein
MRSKKMKTRTNRIWLGMMILLLGLGGVSWAEDLGTVFSYQGRLETAGSEPLNGSYDFEFSVHDTPLVGTGTPVGESMSEPNVPVTEGIFTVQLNPDPNGTAPNLFNGEVRYLEIAVRKTGSAESPFTISPRQRINAAPYAITASSARWLRGRNSAEKVVYVDDTGNVGIGTTSPTAKLEVNGNIKTVGIYEDAYGNVGIGTTIPTSKLEITGPNYSTALKVQQYTANPILQVSGLLDLPASVKISKYRGAGNNYAEIQMGLEGNLVVIKAYETGWPLYAPYLATNAVFYAPSITAYSISATEKQFVINHPLKPGKKLVHACIEGPEIAVYYRGSGKLIDGQAGIELPEYFDALTRDNTATVQLTARGKRPFLLSYNDFNEKSFVVYASVPAGEFDWEVRAVRADVEPLQVERDE